MTIRTLACGVCIGLITAVCWGQATAPATQPTTTAAGGLGNFVNRPLVEPRLELPASIGRGDTLKGTLYLPDAVSLSEAKVFARVSDSLGRLLVDREIPLLLPRPREGGAIVIPLEIALGPVIAIQHTLTVRVTGGGREYTASRAFLVSPPRAWDDYICGIWQRHNPKRVPYLQQMYLSWSQWSGTGVTVPEPWLAADYRYYVESTGNWVYSPYHIHMEGKPKNHYFTEAKEAFKKDRTNLTNLGA